MGGRQLEERITMIDRLRVLTLGVLVGAAIPAAAVEPWCTYRGNEQRTGNTDGIAGPKQPKVLWAVKTNDHFIASPVPFENRLYISGLGSFNVAHFLCLDTDPGAKERTVWARTTPYLKLPTVSSPAITKSGVMVFGDGMHQTDGAILHCLTAATGMPLWQYPVPGRLVHLEGSPTVHDGKVYIGGGAAGVFCVELNRATLDKKELDLDAIRKLVDQRWKELVAAYEKDKVKNEFAVPPNEDMLPRGEPKQFWRQGEEKWHVDAPVALVGDKVIASSAFLTAEKVGDRAVFCLDAKNGNIVWRAPMDLNPWAGPSVTGKLVVVGTSSVNYDYNALKGAKGEVVALNLDDGKPKWRKQVKGGVLSTVALAGDAAIATATDGKVRAYELAGGTPRWVYDAKNPFFGPPAVVGDVVYAGDLKGVLHAIDLSTGLERWTLDLGADPATKAPGMIYGGPIVHGGRIYLATCNLDGASARQTTVIACIGEK
jgi:outer membrane protein assembly factor BamB